MNRDPNLELYIKAAQKGILKHAKFSPLTKHNLTPLENMSLEELQNRRDIVINPADKRGAIIIMDKSWYKNEALRQLRDASFNTPLNSKPTQKYSSNITRVLKRFHKDKKIDNDLFDLLAPTERETGRFYMLPKIHKLGTPGRPIIASNGAITENIWSFVDFLIRDLRCTFLS